jgi:hypothetical protein
MKASNFFSRPFTLILNSSRGIVNHTDLISTSLLALAELHMESAPAQAEAYASRAICAAPSSHLAWYALRSLLWPYAHRRSLGMALKGMGRFEDAADAFMTALQLEGTAPAAPFSLVPKLM